jgi:hypothetical protein
MHGDLSECVPLSAKPLGAEVQVPDPTTGSRFGSCAGRSGVYEPLSEIEVSTVTVRGKMLESGDRP